MAEQIRARAGRTSSPPPSVCFFEAAEGGTPPKASLFAVIERRQAEPVPPRATLCRRAGSIGRAGPRRERPCPDARPGRSSPPDWTAAPALPSRTSSSKIGWPNAGKRPGSNGVGGMPARLRHERPLLLRGRPPYKGDSNRARRQGVAHTSRCRRLFLQRPAPEPLRLSNFHSEFAPFCST